MRKCSECEKMLNRKTAQFVARVADMPGEITEITWLGVRLEARNLYYFLEVEDECKHNLRTADRDDNQPESDH